MLLCVLCLSFLGAVAQEFYISYQLNNSPTSIDFKLLNKVFASDLLQTSPKIYILLV